MCCGRALHVHTSDYVIYKMNVLQCIDFTKPESTMNSVRANPRLCSHFFDPYQHVNLSLCNPARMQTSARVTQAARNMLSRIHIHHSTHGAPTRHRRVAINIHKLCSRRAHNSVNSTPIKAMRLILVRILIAEIFFCFFLLRTPKSRSAISRSSNPR